MPISQVNLTFYPFFWFPCFFQLPSSWLWEYWKLYTPFPQCVSLISKPWFLKTVNGDRRKCHVISSLSPLVSILLVKCIFIYSIKLSTLLIWRHLLLIPSNVPDTVLNALYTLSSNPHNKPINISTINDQP